MFFALRRAGFKGRAYLSDANHQLLATFKAVQDTPDRLLRALTYHRRGYEDSPEAYFYRIRTAYRKDPYPAQFVFLNKTCFNGLYRVNSKGEFNAPWGKYPNPKIVDYRAIRAAYWALKHTTLMPVDYREHFNAVTERPGHDPHPVIQKGSLVYVDPPYYKTFTGYSKRVEKDFRFHERLAWAAFSLAERGAHVMVSNSDHPEIRKLYKGWNVETVTGRRSISRNGGERRPVDDLLIRSW